MFIGPPAVTDLFTEVTDLRRLTHSDPIDASPRDVVDFATNCMDSLYESIHGGPEMVPTCAYKTKRGTACTREAVEESPYCILHGAPVAKAQEQVQRRLMALQEKSIQVAEDILVAGSDKERALMVIAVWDRTGLGPKSTIKLEKQSEDLTDLSEEDLAKELDSLNDKFRNERNRRRMNEAIMNAGSAPDTRH